MSRARRRLRPLPLMLGLVALILALAALLSREAGRMRDGPIPAAADREASHAHASRRLPPLEDALSVEVDTPQELRSVVRYCREAGRSSAARLKHAALVSAEPCVAGNSIRALGRLGLARSDSEMTGLLSDPRPRIRQEAVIALGRSGDPGAVESLAPLLRNEDATLRALAIQALGRLGGTRARSLVEAILSDPTAPPSDRAFARAARTSAEPTLDSARGTLSATRKPDPGSSKHE